MTRQSLPALGLSPWPWRSRRRRGRRRTSPRPTPGTPPAAHGPAGVDDVTATPEPITGHGHAGPRQSRAAEHPRAAAAAGDLDGRRLRHPAAGPRPVRLEAPAEGAPRARGAPRALPARGRAGPERGRAAHGRAPEEHGQGRRAGPRHDRGGAAGGRGDRREIVQKAQAEAEASQRAGRARHRHGPRPGPRRDLAKTADLAVSVAGKVLAKSLGPDDHRRLVDVGDGRAARDRPTASGGAVDDRQVRPDPDLIAGTVFDEAKADLARTYAEALLNGRRATTGRGRARRAGRDPRRGRPRPSPVRRADDLARTCRRPTSDRVLVELFEGRALPTVVNFLRVLNRHGRLGLLAGDRRAGPGRAGTAGRTAGR